MLTVLEALNSATEYLEKKGIKSARLNSELLLSHTLNCRRLDLYLGFERPLKINEIDSYREFIKRRGKFEPLQYIIGKVEFYGLEIEVNPSVLIPRPETELLVEIVIESLKNIDSPNILDIGSGSGNISIALAKNILSSKIIGIDISPNAISTSIRNAKLHQVDDRIMFVNKNVFEEIEFSRIQFDAVVSNPPYVSINEYADLDPELRLYEPKIALTDGSDGLSYYKKIAFSTGSFLKKGGIIFFEIGIHQAEPVKTILTENGFRNIEIKKDYSDINRIILGVKN